jgi:hypothetical protein
MYSAVPKSTLVFLSAKKDGNPVVLQCTANELVGEFWLDLKRVLYSDSNAHDVLLSRLEEWRERAKTCNDRILSVVCLKKILAIEYVLFGTGLKVYSLTFMQCGGHDCWSSNNLLHCSKCQTVAYCCRQCQVYGWKHGHKQNCLLLKEFFKDAEKSKRRTRDNNNNDDVARVDDFLNQHGYSNLEHFLSLNPSMADIFNESQ